MEGTAEPLSPNPRGRGRGRGRGQRGPRGGPGRGRGASRQPYSEAATDPSFGRPPGGSFGSRLTDAAPQEQGNAATETNDKSADGAQDDADLCFICASPIDHVAIGPCNHQTCHICALRMRALYKSRACTHCRTEAPFTIFTDNSEKQFQDFTDNDFVKIDENLGIKFEKQSILEDTILLLRYNCPDQTCDMACQSWPHLQNHVRGKHGKAMCDLCVRNKKVFAHEHEMFTHGDLRRHQAKGDDQPGAVDQTGFRGHPECGFCKERFYGDDELYTHCREKHERCHICDRLNGGRNPQYYLNYQELERHFASEHFVCLDPECQANKTNVFESEMDLKAHQISEHAGSQSKDVRRDQRLVNLSGFDLRTPYQPQRDRRGAGRGRDPNAEPLPVSSAQPMSRAELAYQRQMAIQTSQTVAPRTFGGQLTQSVPTPRPQPSQQTPRPQQTSQQPPALDTLTLSADATPADRARNLRHAAVTERASNLLGNDATKLSQFRTYVSSYRTSASTAADLIDACFSLFDASPAELGILVRELADLYENEVKKTDLLSAWNNWRSINEDYPTLPLPQGAAPSDHPDGLVNVGAGRRVLKLKSSTARSSQSSTARQASWSGISTSAAPRQRGVQPARMGSDAFPSLPATSSTRSNNANPTFSWANTSSLSSSGTPRTINITSTTATRTAGNTKPGPAPVRSADAFPSLPTTAKPLNTMISGFNTRTYSSRGGSNKNSGTSTPLAGGGGSVWASPTPAQAARAVEDAFGGGEAVNGDGSAGKGKGKAKKGKGKGEMLFHFG